MLTPDQIQAARQQFNITPVQSNTGMTRSQSFMQAVKGTPSNNSQPQQQGSFGDVGGAISDIASGASSDFKNAQSSMSDVAERQLSGKQNVLSSLWQGLGVGAKLGNDLIGTGLKAFVNLNVPQPVQDAVGGAISSTINNSPVLKAGLDAAKTGMDNYNQWAQTNPKEAADLSSLVNIPLFAAQFVGGGEAPKVGEALAPKVGEAIDTAKGAIQGAKESIGTSLANKATDSLENTLRETATKYTRPKTILTEAESQGSKPVNVLMDYGKQALPTVEKGKLNTTEAQDFLKNQIKELGGLKSDVVKATDKPTSWAQFRQQTEDLINNQKGWTETKKAQILKEVNDRFNQMVDAYGSKSLPLEEIDKIKSEETALSKAYNNRQPSFQYDTHGIIGKAARNIVENGTGDANISELNKWIQSHYDAIDLLKSLDGKAPHGGAIGRALSNIAGEVAGGIAGGAVGHPILGMAGGRIASESVQNIINSHLISNPLKRMLLGNMEADGQITEDVMQKALDYIGRQGAETIPKAEGAIPETMNATLEKPIGILPKSSIPPDLQPLAEEARKYKSADEFVKAKADLMHGGSGGIGGSEDGVFLTPDKKYAQVFSGKNGVIENAFANVKKTFQIPKVEEGLDYIGSSVNKDTINDSVIEAPQYHKELIAQLKKEGYDSLRSSDGRQLLVLDPKNVMTKSQLTDFYNQATKGK